jgi:hypothetical protein
MTTDQHLDRLRRFRLTVEENERRWRDSIKERNRLVREAKQAGVPAAAAYDAAGINGSTFSRQQEGGATGSGPRRTSRG